jgi:hypothetical protein
MSTQYLTGVLQTGAPRTAGVPVDARHGLQVVQGETLTLIMRVLTPNGVPVLVSGRDFRMTIRRNPRDLTGLAGAVGSARPDLGVEYWQFVIPFVSTVNFRPGVLCYDVWTRLSDDREALIPTSPLYVTAAAGFSMLEPT